jgi:nucleotide-binding universal stress UspA family protein
MLQPCLGRAREIQVSREAPELLVAVSGSVASRRATAIAADLANTFDARLTILHVVPPLQYRVGRLAPTLPITQRLDDPLSNPVLARARQIAWADGVSPRLILIAGDPAPVILAVARDLAADLLVVGTKPRLLPGALATRRRRWLHAHAPCPVLEVTAEPPTPLRSALDPILAT